MINASVCIKISSQKNQSVFIAQSHVINKKLPEVINWNWKLVCKRIIEDDDPKFLSL